jgi:hypothetical protein
MLRTKLIFNYGFYMDYKPPKVECKFNYWGQKPMMDLMQKQVRIYKTKPKGDGNGKSKK